MKVNFKRVATAALAVAMSLSLSVPAFAEGNGGDRTLTVTGDTLDNKNVYAVQMFTARVSADAGSNTFDSYELAQEWMPFFKDTTGAGINLGDQDSDGVVDSDDARAYVEKLEGQSLVDFADKAQAWVRSHDGQPSDAESTDEQKVFANKIITVTANSDTAQFTDLQPGYYLVYPEGGFTGEYEDGTRTTDAMLVNVPRDNDAVLNIKSTFPTVDKTVEDNNSNTTGDGANGSAQVGDEVTFTLTSKVPDMSDFDTYYFAFIDTLSKGLDLSIAGGAFAETDVTVYIYNAEEGEKADDAHKVNTDAFNASYVTNPSKTLKVEFSDLKNVQVNNAKVEAGDTIQVVYKATINEEAVTGQDESFGNAENSVKLEYSNNPSDDGHGESTPDISKVYTYDIDVNKFADDVNDLAGAEFVLSTNVNAPTEEQIESDYNGYSGLISLVKNSDVSYRVATTEDQTTQKSFTTVATGDINIAGLEAGTYYLHEVKAPDGYNKLKAPVKIVITITSMDTGAANITVNDVAASGDGTTVDVENKQGIELPETGSIGTIGLTALGVVVVVAGLFAFPRKKKNRQD